MIDTKELRQRIEENEGGKYFPMDTVEVIALLDELDRYTLGFREFYDALEFEDAEKFFAGFTPDDAQRLGAHFTDVVREKLQQRTKLLEVLKATRSYFEFYKEYISDDIIRAALKSCSDIKTSEIQGHEIQEIYIDEMTTGKEGDVLHTDLIWRKKE